MNAESFLDLPEFIAWCEKKGIQKPKSAKQLDQFDKEFLFWFLLEDQEERLNIPDELKKAAQSYCKLTGRNFTKLCEIMLNIGWQMAMLESIDALDNPYK